MFTKESGHFSENTSEADIALRHNTFCRMDLRQLFSTVKVFNVYESHVLQVLVLQ